MAVARLQYWVHVRCYMIHLIFAQIGEDIGFVDENIIQNAFFSTWCEKYPDEVKSILENICEFISEI